MVVVTGATAGIGRETALGLAATGATVVGTGRNPDPEQLPLGIEWRPLDLASMASVRSFAAGLLADHDDLAVLVNNAGVMTGEREVTEDGFEMTFAVNHLGPFLLTQLLRERLVARPPARVVTVASLGHRLVRDLHWDDLHLGQGRFRPPQAYAQSKLASVLFTAELARREAASGLWATCLHPGTVNTGFGGEYYTGVLGRALDRLAPVAFATPARGARTSLWLATGGEGAVNGGYHARCRARRPSGPARDPARAARLWAISEGMVAGAGR